MSMPIIKPSGVKRSDSVTDIIESVALQQTSLSHILNAEGEKIQAALKTAQTTDELLQVNDSVKSMVNSITRLETLLQGKLELFNNCICETNSTCVTSALELTLSNPLGGVIINQSPNIYLFTGTTLATDIIFETTPQVSIASTSTLPAGMTFTDNKLSIPANFNFGQAYSMTFMIGTDDCKYEITINTAII